jgi:hypothetical protein
MNGKIPVFSLVVLLLMAGALSLQLFVQPIVGAANSGDFERVMMIAGIDVSPANTTTRYFAYLNSKYSVDPLHPRIWYLSSQLLVAEAAVLVNYVVSKDGLLDIRVLGALHTALFLLAMWMIFRATASLLPWQRVAIGVLSLLIFCDVGYVDYFNSFYSEAGSYVFLLLMVGLALLIMLGKYPRATARSLIIWFFIVSALEITSKAQNAFLGIPIALFGYWLVRHYWGGESRRTRFYLPRVIYPALMIALSIFYYCCGRAPEVSQCNIYNVVFHEILRHSSTPVADLSELGADTKYAYLAGTDWYSPHIPKNTPGFRETFYQTVTYGRIIKFYLMHPLRFISLALRDSVLSFGLHPDYIGNFEKSAGYPPYAQSRAFRLWSNFKESLPVKPLLFGLFFLISITVVIVKYRRLDRSTEQRMTSGLHAFLLGMAVIEYLMVVLGDGGGEVLKHMYLFGEICDVCFIMLVVYAIGWYAERVKAPLLPRVKKTALRAQV